MRINKTSLFEVITKTIVDIDQDLIAHDKGIFFAPELYIAFCMGKSIHEQSSSIFQINMNLVEWERETKIPNYGIFDIGFKTLGDLERMVIIELKLIDKGQNYKRDIEKLRSLSNVLLKLFCVLVDTDKEKGNDNRMNTLKKETGLNPTYIERISNQPIWHPRLKLKKYYCDLVIYEI